MHKAIISVMMVAALAAVTGCFTAASAHTKKTTKDGSVIESYVSVVGTGDKVSQIAAEGMFADGTEEDLGSGFKKANASQQSTGIAETLGGVGTLLGNVAKVVAASQGVPTATAVAPQAVEAETSVAQPTASSEPAVVTAPVAAAAPAPPKTVTGAATAPKIVIFGNRATCSFCKGLWNAIDPAVLSVDLCGATVVDADKTDNPAVYAASRPGTAFQYPLVIVYDETGKAVGQFTARNFTQSAFEAKVRELVPSCAAPAAK